jgi:hypothetical protein
MTVLFSAILLAVLRQSLAADITADDYIHYYSPLFGSWRMTSEVDGDSVPGLTHWRSGADRQCLLIDSQTENEPAVQSVQGYDVTTKTWKIAAFDGQGHFTVGMLDHTAIKPGAVLSVGQVGIWKDTVFKNGKAVARIAKVGCEKLGPNQAVLAWTDIQEDGKNAPSIRITLDRLPETQAPGTPDMSLPNANGKPGPDYEQLKQLEWLIGDWEAEWVVPSAGTMNLDDFRPGTKIHSTCSYFWMENKNYIGLKFRDEADGKVLHEGVEVIGVDPQSKKLMHWLSSILGGWGVGEWNAEGKVWVLDWSGTTADRTKYEGVAYHVPLDADTYTWEMKNNKKNGTPTPDSPLVTYHRMVRKAG